MKHVSLNDPDLNLRRLVDELQVGEELVLFDGDRPVAKLSSLGIDRAGKQRAWDDLLALLESQKPMHLGHFDRTELYEEPPR